MFEGKAYRVIRANIELEKPEIRQNARIRRVTAGPEYEETILLERESNHPSEPRSGTGDQGHSLLPGFPWIPRRQATFNIAAWIDLSAHGFCSRSDRDDGPAERHMVTSFKIR